MTEAGTAKPTRRRALVACACLAVVLLAVLAWALPRKEGRLRCLHCAAAKNCREVAGFQFTSEVPDDHLASWVSRVGTVCAADQHVWYRDWCWEHRGWFGLRSSFGLSTAGFPKCLWEAAHFGAGSGATELLAEYQDASRSRPGELSTADWRVRCFQLQAEAGALVLPGG